MSRSKNNSIDYQELDRLVDGQLDRDQYRELLEQIECDPDGWRQCALAFLEHQALSQELSAFAADPACDLLPNLNGQPVEKDFERPARRNGRRPALISWISMALCISTGLALGVTMQSDFRDRLAPPEFRLPGNGAVVGGQFGSAFARPNYSSGNLVYSGDSEKGVSVSDDSLVHQSGNSARRKGDCDPMRDHLCPRTSLQNLKERRRQHDSCRTCPISDRVDQHSGCQDK